MPLGDDEEKLLELARYLIELAKKLSQPKS
jgi:hypothetical protein